MAKLNIQDLERADLKTVAEYIINQLKENKKLPLLNAKRNCISFADIPLAINLASKNMGVQLLI